MKSKTELFELFIEHHEPEFSWLIDGRTIGLFCSGQKCAECRIEKECKETGHNILRKEKEYAAEKLNREYIMKFHPEYLI